MKLYLKRWSPDETGVMLEGGSGVVSVCRDTYTNRKGLYLWEIYEDEHGEYTEDLTEGQ